MADDDDMPFYIGSLAALFLVFLPHKILHQSKKAHQERNKYWNFCENKWFLITQKGSQIFNKTWLWKVYNGFRRKHQSQKEW
jgi:hypothetical protein